MPTNKNTMYMLEAASAASAAASTTIVIDERTDLGNCFHIEFGYLPQWQGYWERGESNDAFYQALGEPVINIPYADEPRYLIECGDDTIYRPNHDVSHSLRKKATIDLLCDTVKVFGLDESKMAEAQLTAEEREATRLAAYLMRSGRSNESSSERCPSNLTRSAKVYEAIALALGFDAELIRTISYGIEQHAPIMQPNLAAKLPYSGFTGDKATQQAKSRLVKAVLDTSHNSDLVRIYANETSIDKDNIENLSGLLQPEYVQTTNKIIQAYSKSACALTGTMFHKHDGSNSMHVPPLVLKLKSIQESSTVSFALTVAAKQYLAYIEERDLVAAEARVEEHMEQVHTLTTDDQAANKIQRAWMQYRAHRVTKEAVKINPLKRSPENLKRIQLELKQGLGLSTKEQSSMGDAGLLPEEQALYAYLVDEFEWTLKHVTINLPEIQANGNALKSLHQRNREERYNDKRYTSDYEGRADNIYFTIASPNGWPAEFLQAEHGHEIRVRIRDFMYKSNKPMDKLYGLWVSSSWFGYNAERDLDSDVGGVRRLINYRKQKEDGQFLELEDSKHYRYCENEGHTYHRTTYPGEEIAAGKELLPFLALNTILELRFAGRDLRQQCLTKLDRQALEAFVDLVYEQRNFEALLPAKLSLNDKRIQILAFNNSVKDSAENIERMKVALATKNTMAITALLDEGVPINIDLGGGVTPLYYIIQNSVYDNSAAEKARYLIKRGANIQVSVNRFSMLAVAVLKGQYEIVEALLTIGIVDKRCTEIRRKLALSIDDIPLKCALYIENTVILDLLLSKGYDFAALNLSILTILTKLPESSALVLFSYLEKGHLDFTQDDMHNLHYAYGAMKECIETEKYGLLEKLLSSGLTPTARDIDSSDTILAFASKRQDERALEIMTRYGLVIEDKPCHEKTMQVHLLIENAQAEILVMKKRYQSGRQDILWRSLYFEGIADSKDKIQQLIFEATGIRIEDACIELMFESEEGVQATKVYKVTLAQRTYKLSETENYAKPRWLSSDSSMADIPLDALTRQYLNTSSHQDIKRLIENKEKLLVAVQQRNQPCVKAMLEQGVSDPDYTALQVACDSSSPDLELIQLLLEAGYNIHAEFIISDSIFCDSALIYAVLHQHKGLLDLLIRNNADINAQIGRYKFTPLMQAVMTQNFEILPYMEALGADVMHPNNKNILAVACWLNCTDSVFDYLLERADCNTAFEGMTALLVCAEQNNHSRIEALLKKGVNTSPLHPELRKTAREIVPNAAHLFEKYAVDSPVVDVNLWTYRNAQYESYLELSGALQRGDVEGELAREYTITMIDETQTPRLQNLAEKLLLRAGLTAQDNINPRIALAEEGDRPVFTCSGFDTPVIAIHRDFLADETVCEQHLVYAIAHELIYIRHSTERQFDRNVSDAKMAYDKAALTQISDPQYAIEYLQKAYQFYEAHHSNENFDWPWNVFKGRNSLFSIPEYDGRIKAMKLNQTILDVIATEDHGLQAPIDFRQLLTVSSFDYYPDFPSDSNSLVKFNYLLENLSGLSIEFIPFIFDIKPSCRLKQFSRRVIDSELTETQLAQLINTAHDRKIPGFSYLYKRVCNFPSMATTGSGWAKDISLRPLGYFKTLYNLMQEFIDLTNGDISDNKGHEINAIAEQIMKLYERLSEDMGGYCHYTYLTAHMSANNGALPRTMPYQSELVKIIQWPKLALNRTHLALLNDDRSNLIWKVLWLMGAYKDGRLYPYVPKPFLDEVINITSSDITQPVLLTILQPFNVKYVADYARDVLQCFQKSLSNTVTVDTSMLKGNFANEFEDFMKANRIHFDASPENPNHIKASKILLEQFDDMLQGDEDSKRFVIDYFTLYEPFYFQTLFSSYEPFAYRLYYDFLLRHKVVIPTDCFYKIANSGVGELYGLSIGSFLDGLGFDGLDDDVRMIKAIPYLIQKGNIRIAELIIDDYIQKHGPFDAEKQHTIDLLEFLNANGLASWFVDHLRLKRSTFNHLSVRQAVLLYRLLDEHMKFPNYNDKRHFSGVILKKIAALTSPEHRIQMLEQMLFTKESFSTIALSDKILAKNIIALLTEAYALKFGPDDGSQHYFRKISALLDRCSASTSGIYSTNLFEALLCAIESQELVSHYIGCQMEPEKHENRRQRKLSDYHSFASSQFAKIARNEIDKRHLLDFISSPLTEDSLETFSRFIFYHPKKGELLGWDSQALTFDQVKEKCRSIYHDFWYLRLEQRAVLLDSLLITAEEESSEERFGKAYRRGFDYMTETLFPNKASDAREDFAYHLLSTYLEVADANERQFLLAGLLTVSNESEGEEVTIGRKMVLLCEHMGPAYIKLAQAIHSHPDTPQDIKKDLAHVKGRANPPYRWQIWRHMKDVLPNEVFNQIKHLGKVLGSASYNIAIEIELEDKAELVVTLLRENARQDAHKGFAHLKRTITACSHEQAISSRETLLNMIDQAELMSHQEIDNDISNQQYEIASQFYDGHPIAIEQEGETYTVKMAACANIANGPGYKLLTKMPGNEFNDLPSLNSKDRLIKTVIAKAVMMKELSILMNGGQFDSDRHGSQLRVDVNDKTISLGLYDFGEMSLEPLNETELRSYAALLQELPQVLKDDSSIDRLFQRHIQQAMASGEPHSHLMRVNKALLALSDFRKELTKSELKEIIEQIIASAHPLLKENLVSGFRQSLSVWEKGLTLFSHTMRKAAASASQHLGFPQP